MTGVGRLGTFYWIPGGMMPGEQPDVLRGTLDLLVLKTLAREPMHGWGIAQRIEQFSRGVLSINQGSLYLALQRLERGGCIAAEWRSTDNNRNARYYRLTGKGQRLLRSETAAWQQYVTAVTWVLRTT